VTPGARRGSVELALAAGLGPENPAEDVTEADLGLTCAVNLKGTFFVSQAVGR
jgi:NAD(P)-dependent dehydrogenase (short-subunit alcohol dehydrogenase family)